MTARLRTAVVAYGDAFGLTPLQVLRHSAIGMLFTAGVLIELAFILVIAGGGQ